MKLNPISHLYFYLIFGLSIILSKSPTLILVHFLVLLALIFYNKNKFSKWKKLVIQYQKLFVLGGLILFAVSFIVTEKSINTIIGDSLFAMSRVVLLTSSMALYVVCEKSQNLIAALRSIWYYSKFEFKCVEKIFIYFELSLRFFPIMEQKWFLTDKSQKALSINIRKNQLSKVIQWSKYLPDFIILNLDQAEKIVKNMSLRGFGKKPKRSTYPIVVFNVYDFFFITLILMMIISIHYVKI